MTPLRFCDLTFAYTATSGGIRTYLDQKRQYLLEHTPHEHILIVPAESDSIERDGRCTTYRLASPLIPGCEPYRFFCRPDVLLSTLREAKPDIVELGSFFLEPWAAFHYRQDVIDAGGRCLVSGYFHTDLANAYVGGPLRAALGAQLVPGSELMSVLGLRLAEWIAAGATGYFGSIFKRCDQMLAASHVQAQRLAEYGVDQVKVIPLGVDLARFDPRKKSAAVRDRLGVSENGALIVFAGRLDVEKRVTVLISAFRQLKLTHAVLVLVGEGPLRPELEQQMTTTPGLVMLPYQKNPDELAELLASADVYVTAGAHETFGLSVVEAQASGLPVVGVRSGALVERVPEGTGLLGPVDDAEVMARNIEETVRHAANWGRAARRHVVEGRFDWVDTFRRLLDVYDELWVRSSVPPELEAEMTGPAV